MTLVCAPHQVVLDQLDFPSPIDHPTAARSYRIPTSFLLGLVGALEILGHLKLPALAMIGRHPLGAVGLDSSNLIIWVCKSRVSTVAILVVATAHVSITTPFYYILGGRAFVPKAAKEPKRFVHLRQWYRLKIDNQGHRFRLNIFFQWMRNVRGQLVNSTDSRLIGLVYVFLWPCRETAIMAGTLRLSRFWFAVANLSGKVVRLWVLIYFGLIAAQLVAYAVYPLAAAVIGFNALLKRLRIRREVRRSAQLRPSSLEVLCPCGDLT